MSPCRRPDHTGPAQMSWLANSTECSSAADHRLTSDADVNLMTEIMLRDSVQAPASTAQGSPQRYFKRSDSEIQRNYDAAVGPPEKKGTAGPPSAPPAPSASLPRPASPALPTPPPTGDFLRLPALHLDRSYLVVSPLCRELAAQLHSSPWH